ncbi:MAG: DUF5016 domain-containing protein [Tannerellaceae bacterium]|jgi:hypothetical protein|nr:DUF5016 domain-containing protein [Tannerellaceae bacterium]
MKTFKVLFLLIFISGMVISCGDDDANTTVSVPLIESMSIQGGENIKLRDSIYFNAKLSDAARPLSTLEVELLANDIVISSKSIRTKGNSVSLENISLFVPFASNIATGDELKVNFTLINVDGGEAKAQKTIKAIRPELAETLYLILSDKSVIELYANEKKPDSYESEEGIYPNTFNAKIATAKDLADAEYIWNAGVDDNVAAIGDRFGADVKFSYTSWLVKKIIFNAFSFTFDVEGLKLDVRINDVQMMASGEYFYASVDFAKDVEVEIQGIDNIEQAYNRDFFEYNPGTGKCKFIGESGKWDVYYSSTYNYVWINRMSDVAPATYWIIGQGFSSTPKWYGAFNSIGWDLEDIKQLAYMYPMGSNKYRATIYLSSIHDWGGFDIQVFGKRMWGAEAAIFADDRFTGDKEGMFAGGALLDNILMSDGFVSGYYRLTLDLSEGLENAWMNFEKLSE